MSKKTRCNNNQLTVLPEVFNCNHLECNKNKDLYYNRKQSEKYDLAYPSPKTPKIFPKEMERI